MGILLIGLKIVQQSSNSRTIFVGLIFVNMHLHFVKSELRLPLPSKFVFSLNHILVLL